MDEDKINIEVRKFLKKVGITAQRKIEPELIALMHDDKLRDNEVFEATAEIKIHNHALGAYGIHVHVNEKINLAT